MASQVIYDLSAKVGTYIKDGVEKPRWAPVGKIMRNDEGKFFMLMNKYFNPAGVPDAENRDSILVSMFKSGGGDDDQAAPPPRQDAHNRAKANGYAPQPKDDFVEDDIPF
jgi:hypothetical protein